ncbi:MAG: peptidase S58 family protein [Proteobacteria bacterium]|nr:peptidase S58 family protein [Pseudomonadota bacterium]
MYDAITDIDGIRVGHFSHFEALTGCTVLLCEEGAVAAADIWGAATGTRQIDALSPGHLVERIHGVCLAGGSAFGLDAAGGVMKFLEERGRGFDVGITKVPIVPAGVIFDLGVGDYRVRPDAEMGYKACMNARGDGVEEGSVGAGTGATVGKLFGVKCGMKGGIGTASMKSKSGATVGVLVVVNAFGDIIDPSSGRILAGARESEKSMELANSSKRMMEGAIRRQFAFPNTTLAIIATDVHLNREDLKNVIRLTHNGLAKTISPLHTTFDGDVIFALSLGKKEADVNTVGILGEGALIHAIMRSVQRADGLGFIPAFKDISP